MIARRLVHTRKTFVPMCSTTSRTFLKQSFEVEEQDPIIVVDNWYNKIENIPQRDAVIMDHEVSNEASHVSSSTTTTSSQSM
jgi:hypothetical protein